MKRFGFTLLELMLSLAVLASVTGLTATMWSQIKRWSDDQMQANQAMRLDRALNLMRDQWSARRSAASVDDEGRKVHFGANQLTFISSVPILFPDWPLVQVSYRIERDDRAPLAAGLRYRIVYEEIKVTQFESIPEAGTDINGKPLDARMTLLENCESLAWQWLSILTMEEAEQERLSTLRSEDEGEAPQDEIQRLRWRADDDVDQQDIPAIRMDGRHDGEDFSCVFVVRALR